MRPPCPTPWPPRTDDRLAIPAKTPGFLDGAGSLFAGFGFVITTPAVWPLAIVPVAVAALVTALLGSAAIALLVPWIGGLLPGWAITAAILKFVAGALAVVFSGVIGLGVAQGLSGPALDGIVRRAEAREGAPAWPATSFTDNILRSLQSALVAWVFGLPILAVLFLVSFFFPPASIVTFPLKLVVIAVLLAWDLCDYPLSARGIPVKDRVAFISRHWTAMIGFGAGLALLSLIPCALLLVLPAGVAGAARLVVRLERADGRTFPVARARPHGNDSPHA